jgi:hypothetical protein
MNIHIEPVSRLTQRATRVLVDELGVVDTMRFLNQFRDGIGNYTTDRKSLFKDTSVKDIVAEIKARRDGSGLAAANRG